MVLLFQHSVSTVIITLDLNDSESVMTASFPSPGISL